MEQYPLNIHEFPRKSRIKKSRRRKSRKPSKSRRRKSRKPSKSRRRKSRKPSKSRRRKSHRQKSHKPSKSRRRKSPRKQIRARAIRIGQELGPYAIKILVVCHGNNSDPNPYNINYGLPINQIIDVWSVDPDQDEAATYRVNFEDLNPILDGAFDIVRFEFCYTNMLFRGAVYAQANIRHEVWDKVYNLLKIGGKFQISENYINENEPVYRQTWISKNFRRGPTTFLDNFENTIVQLIKY